MLSPATDRFRPSTRAPARELAMKLPCGVRWLVLCLSFLAFLGAKEFRRRKGKGFGEGRHLGNSSIERAGQEFQPTSGLNGSHRTDMHSNGMGLHLSFSGGPRDSVRLAA